MPGSPRVASTGEGHTTSKKRMTTGSAVEARFLFFPPDGICLNDNAVPEYQILNPKYDPERCTFMTKAKEQRIAHENSRELLSLT